MVNNPVSIEPTNGQLEKVMVFPNPTIGLINISLNSLPGKTAMVEISNMEGKIVHSKTFNKGIGIDMTDNPKGIYMIILIVDGEILVRRICLQ